MDRRKDGEVVPKIIGTVTEEERIAWQECVRAMYHKSLWDNRGMWYIFLRHWCDGKDVFRREFAHPYRRVTRSIRQLHKQIIHFGWENQNHCYLSNFEFARFEDIPKERRRKGSDRVERPVYSDAIINKIPLEFDQASMCPRCRDVVKKASKGERRGHFDCKICGWTDHSDVDGYDDEFPDPYIQSLFDVWREVRSVWEHVGDAVVVFTGGRGFQLYERLDDVINADELKSRQKEIAGAVPTISLDCGHLGDVARVYRIPFTLHVGKLRFCIPVQPDLRLKEILRKSMEMRVPDVIEPVTFKMGDYSDEGREEIVERVIKGKSTKKR